MTKNSSKSSKPRMLFFFQFYFMGRRLPIYGTMSVEANSLDAAEELMTQRGNDLADQNKKGTGYKCVADITLKTYCNDVGMHLR